jgi:hypothetical protein
MEGSMGIDTHREDHLTFLSLRYIILPDSGVFVAGKEMIP